MDKYEIIKEFKQGGMAKVYQAKERSTGNIVAIKILKQLENDTQAKIRFEREIMALQKIKHENVVSILDTGKTKDNIPYLVEPFLQGITLREFLDSRSHSVEESTQLSFQLLSGVAAVHKNGIVHRDLKPSNIVLEDNRGEYHLKILDFGVAKLLHDKQKTLTITGVGVGTAKYMSPEQALNAKYVDERADVFSIGLIMYELFTQKNPLEYQSNFNAAIPSFIPRPISVNPTLNPHIEKVILCSISRTREQRYANAYDQLLAFSKAAYMSPTLPIEDTSF